MKRILILIYVLSQATHLVAMKNNSYTNSKFIELSYCINEYDKHRNNSPENEILYWKTLKKTIHDMGPLSQQDMTDSIAYSLAGIFEPHIAKKLLIMWHEKININLLPQKQNNLIPQPLFNEIVCRYGQSLYLNCPTKNPVHTLYNQAYEDLYDCVCTVFKSNLNINIKHAHQTPFMLTCKRFIAYQERSMSCPGPHKAIGAFLEGFLEQFHDYIDFFATNAQNENAFNLCEIKDNDEARAIYNKKNLLLFLKKYCPEKLLFTKRHEKLHNCHFLFIKDFDYHS